MSSIVNNMNSSLLSSSFSSTALSATSQRSLFASAVSQNIPDVSFDVGGETQALSVMLASALSSGDNPALLNALAQVGSYEQAGSLLESAYGSSSSLTSLLGGSYGSSSSSIYDIFT